MNRLRRFLYTLDDYWVRARNVMFEAMGETIEGQVAVDWVVKNRMADSRWPDTAKEVILQKQQFSWTIKAAWNRLYWVAFKPWQRFPTAWATAKEVVDMVDGGALDPTGGATHYLNVAVTKKYWGLPRWFDARKITAEIGRHTFLKL
jgi:spore germination cell wall hydrolase CwlJ-like protein